MNTALITGAGRGIGREIAIKPVAEAGIVEEGGMEPAPVQATLDGAGGGRAGPGVVAGEPEEEGRLPFEGGATAAGTKVMENSAAPRSAIKTVTAMGVNIFPSTPVSVRIGR